MKRLNSYETNQRVINDAIRSIQYTLESVGLTGGGVGGIEPTPLGQNLVTWSNIDRAVGFDTFAAVANSANLALLLTDETGSGAAVFADSPSLIAPNLGTPSAAVLSNCTGLPISTGVSGLGTGVATFLGVPTWANFSAAVPDVPVSAGPPFATSITPTINDGAALGVYNYCWSDLLLADGGTINWSLGNTVLTHSSNLLTLGGGGFKVTPSAGQTQALNTLQYLSGTGTAGENANQFVVSSDSVSVPSGGFLQHWAYVASIGGTSMTGGRTMITGQLNLAAATNALNPNRFYCAAEFIGKASASDGGAVGNAKGAIFGLNSVGWLTSSATNMNSCISYEADVWCEAGSSVVEKVGVLIAQINTDKVSGSLIDAAMLFVNQAGTPGWRTLFLIGDGLHSPPLKATGSIMAFAGAQTLNNGIDLSGGTFTGAAFFSPNFIVYGTGGVTLASPTGGNKGPGTMNVQVGIYKNNSAYANPDYALEHYYTDTIQEFQANDGAAEYGGLMPLDKLDGFMRANYCLPMARKYRSEPCDIFSRADVVMEKVEEAFIYLTQLHQRVSRLERDD